MSKYKWTLPDLVSKIDYEAGLGESLYYFGREVNSVDDELNEAWRRAYDAVEVVAEMLPEFDGSGDEV